MPLPTLLQPGFLIPPDWMSQKEADRLKAQIPINYILNFLSDRIPERKGGKPKIQPKTPGEKVIVLKSSTGSGKSTTLPSSLYTNFIEKTKKNIAVTQPRVLTCVDIPQGIVEFAKDLEMDRNIGYNTGNFKRLPKEKGVIFCTTEIIAQQFLMAETDQDFMQQYQFIIIDEVHTRDLAIDRLLFLMKNLLRKNFDDPECPILILTSATFDETIFMEYFNVPKEHYISVEGFAYPKTSFYPKYDIIDYKNYAIKKALQIHIENISDVAGGSETKPSEFRDIMIFVPTSSIGEKILKEFLFYNCSLLNMPWSKVLEWKRSNIDSSLEDIQKDLKAIIHGGAENMNYYLLPILLTSATFSAGGLEYQNMFSPIDTISLPIWNITDKDDLDVDKKPDKFVIPSRRVIIGTNIAETGITIDSLKYCIDTGYEFHVEFNPDFGAPLMMMKPCTQGMVIQRKGRVGRKSPGFWYPCFTEDTFNKMQKDQYADIIMADPIDNLLNILIKETDTGFVEEENQKIIKEKILQKKKDIFQKNYLTDGRWWKIKKSKKISIGAIDFLEMPSGPSLEYAIEKLHCLGLIDDNYDITIFGIISNLIRFIPVEAKRMILAGFNTGASINDLIIIAAFIQTGKQFVFNKKFKMPNVLDIKNFEAVNRFLIGDELINCILLWNEFNRWVHKKMNKYFKNGKGDILEIEEIKEWCDSNNILYAGWITMITNRDTLIENLLSVGINIYYNGINLPYSKYNLNEIIERNLEDGIQEINKLKQSIYQGYLLNVCEWNSNKKKYVLLSKNMSITIKSPLINSINSEIQNKPKYVIVTKYVINSTMGSTFDINGSDFISILDGHVNPDPRILYN